MDSNYENNLAAALSQRLRAVKCHHWLHQQQQRLGELAGEPLFFTIRLIYDGTVETEVNTCTGREGMGHGDTLLAAMEMAVETLLYLDQFRQLEF